MRPVWSPSILSSICEMTSFRDLCSLKRACTAFRVQAFACLKSRFCCDQWLFVGGGYTDRENDSDETDDESIRFFARASDRAFLIKLSTALTDVIIWELPPLPTACFHCSADITPSGNIVIAGSFISGDWVNSAAFIFNPETCSWTSTFDWPRGCVSCVDDQTFICASEHGQIHELSLHNDEWTVRRTVQLLNDNGLFPEVFYSHYDRRRNQLQVLASHWSPNDDRYQHRIRSYRIAMPLGEQDLISSVAGHCYTSRCCRRAGICMLPTGKIVCSGGLAGIPAGGSDGDPGRVLVEQSCEELAFEDSPRAALPNAPVGRFGHKLTLVYDHSLLQFGGSSAVNPSKAFRYTDPVRHDGLMSTMELYDSIGNEWIALPPLPLALYGAGACSFKDDLLGV